MEQKAQNTFLILATVLFAVSMSYSAQIGNIFEYVDNGDYLVQYSIKNTGEKIIKDASISLWIPDLDVYVTTQNFDLRTRNSYSGYMLPLEYNEQNIEPDYYLARVKLHSSRVRISDVQWMWLWVE